MVAKCCNYEMVHHPNKSDKQSRCIQAARCVGSGDATMRVVILVSTAAVVDADVDVPLGPPSLDAPGLPGDVGEAGDVARSAALRFLRGCKVPGRSWGDKRWKEGNHDESRWTTCTTWNNSDEFSSGSLVAFANVPSFFCASPPRGSTLWWHCCACCFASNWLHTCCQRSKGHAPEFGKVMGIWTLKSRTEFFSNSELVLYQK